MRNALAILTAFTLFFSGIPAGFADVVDVEEVISAERTEYEREQLLSYADSAEVQSQLLAMGVDPEVAKLRIARMTDAELAALNAHMQEMPAGGVVGAIVTVLVVIAFLDLLGVTDVYSFINPI